jgi:hypothetical protein
MIKFRLVTVTTRLDYYPYHREDTEEFPHLVGHVDDQIETFVVDEDGGYWESREFFDSTNITHFIVDSSEVPK